MVKQVLLIPFLFLFSASFMVAQEEDHFFEINGTISGIDSGFVQISRPNIDSSFLVPKVRVPILQGKFSLSGRLEFPQRVLLMVNVTDKTLETEWFYIDPGNQSLLVTIADDNLQLKSDGVSFLEHRNNYKPKMDSFKLLERNLFQITEDFKNDSLLNIAQGLKTQKDTFVLEYIKQMPQSYIGADGLLSLIRKNGYAPIYDSSLIYLDKTLQQEEIGKSIQQTMEVVQRLDKGKIFPNFELLDTTNQTINLDRIPLEEYTLIDFWFNSCGYCILEFPDLKALYHNYQDKGFEIISISTDLSRFEANWKKAIQKHELPWPQYWDVDHIQSSALEIHYFPTTFLINKQGEILAKNIDLKELAVFLAANLKK